MDWQPIGSAPKNKRILLWWRPRADPDYPHPPEYASELSNNKYAECCVIGQIPVDEPDKWWNDQTGEYQNIWHVTHWQPLPPPPQ